MSTARSRDNIGRIRSKIVRIKLISCIFYLETCLISTIFNIFFKISNQSVVYYCEESFSKNRVIFGSAMINLIICNPQIWIKQTESGLDHFSSKNNPRMINSHPKLYYDNKDQFTNKKYAYLVVFKAKWAGFGTDGESWQILFYFFSKY